VARTGLPQLAKIANWNWPPLITTKASRLSLTNDTLGVRWKNITPLTFIIILPAISSRPAVTALVATTLPPTMTSPVLVTVPATAVVPRLATAWLEIPNALQIVIALGLAAAFCCSSAVVRPPHIMTALLSQSRGELGKETLWAKAGVAEKKRSGTKLP